MAALGFTASWAGDENKSPGPEAWSGSGAVPEEAVRSARLLRERFLADPCRPGYHFCLPEDLGIPGDPNAAFSANGRFHLMYLYDRRGSGFCFGHVSSVDLVHWRNQPDAIGPGGGDQGCYSGGAFVDEDGTCYLSYWSLPARTQDELRGFRGRPCGGIALAKSGDLHFDSWAKLSPNPVIRSTEFGIGEAKGPNGNTVHYGTADPSNIWKKDGRYYMLTANSRTFAKFGSAADSPISEQGDRTYLFVSDNLKDWTYLHVFYERRPEWTDRSEYDMCPSFLPLPSRPGGGPPSGKHLLLFTSIRGCQYYVGDYRDDRFFPGVHGRMSWNDNSYFAPEALVDAHGRQIMWAWLYGGPSMENAKAWEEESRKWIAREKDNGWSGVYGLPRTLWLGEDGTLRIRPVEELNSLRYNQRSWSGIDLGEGGAKGLEGVRGDSCELSIEIDSDSAKVFGLKVRASADGKEATVVWYDAKAKELVFDSRRSGAPGRNIVERAPFDLKPGEPLRLRVFVDKSVVEAYANDRQAMARCVFPKKDSLGIVLFARNGPARIGRINAWEMMPSNPY